MPARTELEAAFANLIRIGGLLDQWPGPLEEHAFHPTRKWRFDFAWPHCKLAVELEGGVFTGGRHSRGAGMVGDCDKYNAAAVMGWAVLRYTRKHLDEDPVAVLDQVTEAVERRSGMPRA